MKYSQLVIHVSLDSEAVVMKFVSNEPITMKKVMGAIEDKGYFNEQFIFVDEPLEIKV